MAILVLATLASTLGPASAQTSPPTQQMPGTNWVQPGTGNLDGLGNFLYVGPPPAAGATQGSPLGYEFTMSARLEGNAMALLVLGYKNGQRVAGFGVIPDIVITMPFQWDYGRIYYLLTYRLTPTQWGAWIYDWSAGTWSLIAVQTVPEGTGRMLPTARTSVDFDPTLAPAPSAHTSTCAFYPRIDAFWYAPMGWRGEVITNATLSGNETFAGTCPTTTRTSDGWQWYTLGSPA